MSKPSRGRKLVAVASLGPLGFPGGPACVGAGVAPGVPEVRRTVGSAQLPGLSTDMAVLVVKMVNTPPPVSKVLSPAPHVIFHFPSDLDPLVSQPTSHPCSECVYNRQQRWWLTGGHSSVPTSWHSPQLSFMAATETHSLCPVPHRSVLGVFTLRVWGRPGRDSGFRSVSSKCWVPAMARHLPRCRCCS